MKIALLTQYYKPEMGAPQNRLYEMITGLKKLGNEVYIITGMPNYPTGQIFKDYRGKFTISEDIDAITTKRYWLYASNSKKKMPRILNMLSFSVFSLFSVRFLRKCKIDYLIVESPPLTLGLSGYILAKMTGARLICNISDIWPLSAKELGAVSGDGFIYKMLEKVERFIYRKSLFCMGQSSEITDHISNSGANEVYLFRNGVDPKRFTANNNKSEALTKIVYTGLLGYAQGVLDICKNIDFSKLNVEFHIYGAGGEQKELECFLREHPHRGIYFHGTVSRENIPSVLSEYDATLIPLVKHIYGAVPSKIYESMAAGLPIIFSGEGEGERIILENNLGLVSAAKDYQSIIKNIEFLRSNPEELIQKQKKCVECVNNKFNRPKQIEDLNKYLLSKL